MIFSKIIYFAIVSHSLLQIVDATEDYYKLLGIEKTATEQEIKKAFRSLARQYHPDKNKDEGAEEQFRKIAEAYEVLADENQRKKYDQFGHTGKGFGGFKEGFGNFDFSSFFKQFDETFSQFASGFQSRKRDREDRKRKNEGGRFKFNLDDLFSDMDFDEFNFFAKPKKSDDSSKEDGDSDENSTEDSTEDHEFGGGDSFFGSHFNGKDTPEMNFGGFNADGIRKSFQKGFEQGFNAIKMKASKFGSRTCRTVTREVGGTVISYKKCFNEN